MLGNQLNVLMSILIAMLTTGATGQNKPNVAISVWAVSQPEAPLQVTGFQKSSIPTRGIEILLRNVTDQPVKAFRIIAKLQAACPSGGEAEVWGFGSALERKLVPPGASTQAQEQVADATVIGFTKRLKTSFLHVQVGVLEVELADGTVWKNKFPPGSQLFDPALPQSDANRCSEWPTTAEIEQLKGDFAIIRDPSVGTIEIRSNGYFMTCVLK